MIRISEEKLYGFRLWLLEQEYSPATIRKYLHDVSVLAEYTCAELRDKSQLNGFKAYLKGLNYNGNSINSMLGAVNKFLSFLGLEWKLRYVKTQRQVFLPENKELSQTEYEKMVRVAEERGNRRCVMLLQTLCSTGIRVSELSAITVECLKSGEATIQNKGKLRPILIPKALVAKLKRYCADRGILHGPIFVTRTGRPLDRSNVWKMIKKLAEFAKVAKEKAFPHNFRHLFARKYYDKYKDIVRLADILGHGSIDTTRIYTARSGYEERRQLDRLRLVLE